MDRWENLIVLQHEALWLLNGMEPVHVRQPELFPSPPEASATLFLSPGKGRKRIVSNQPGGNANYYADGR